MPQPDDSKLRVAILGCTGSIGRQALDVCAQHSDLLEVVALSAHGKTKELVDAARTHHVACVAVTDSSHATDPILAELPKGTELLFGADALARIVVRDDVHCQTYRGRDVWRGDNVQLCLSLPGEKRFLEIGLTHFPNGKNEVCFWNAIPEMTPSNSVQLKTSRNEKEKTTVYEAVIPWSLIGFSRCPDHLSFNLLVNENDGRGRKLQGALSFPVKDIRSFRTLYFTK